MHGHPSYMRDHHTPVLVPAHTTPLTARGQSRVLSTSQPRRTPRHNHRPCATVYPHHTSRMTAGEHRYPPHRNTKPYSIPPRCSHTSEPEPRTVRVLRVTPAPAPRVVAAEWAWFEPTRDHPYHLQPRSQPVPTWSTPHTTVTHTAPPVSVAWERVPLELPQPPPALPPPHHLLSVATLTRAT
jgi:hypothetical protein